MLGYIAGGILTLWCVYALIPTCYYKYFHRNSLGSEFAEHSLLLTFDDGPDERYTPQLLAILAAYQVKAIFFLPGFKAQRHPELVQQIIDQGHQIGFHGYRHLNPWRLGFWQTKNDFRQGMAALAQLGVQAHWYRPPHGTVTLGNLWFAKRAGMNPLLWTVLVGDWQKIGGDAVLARLMAKVSQRDVMCLHDSGQDTGGEDGAPLGTLAAVEQFIPDKLEQGYHFIELRTGVDDE